MLPPLPPVNPEVTLWGEHAAFGTTGQDGFRR
jgi:hypothetical protein